MGRKSANLTGLDNRFKFPFSVHIKYVGKKRNKDFAGYYKMKRVNGQVQQVEVFVGGDIDEIDDQLMHELQHIHTAWKSGKLYYTDQSSPEAHDKDKNEQIPMTNDIIGELEHRYRNGESLESLEKENNEAIEANIEEKPYIAAQHQKAMILFKKYLEDYNVVQEEKIEEEETDNKYYNQALKLKEMGRSDLDAKRYLELRYRSLIMNKGSLDEINLIREALQMFNN